MRPSNDKDRNVVSLEAKRREKFGLPEPIDMAKERNERVQWPKMKRTTAAFLIGVSGVLTAIGFGQAHEQQTRDQLFQKLTAERQEEAENMTPQERAVQEWMEANRAEDQKATYERLQNQDELSVSSVQTSRNGTETALHAPIEISATSIAHNAESQNDEELTSRGEATGRLAGELQSRSK